MNCGFCGEAGPLDVLREEGFADLPMCVDQLACFFRMDIVPPEDPIRELEGQA